MSEVQVGFFTFTFFFFFTFLPGFPNLNIHFFYLYIDIASA